jgi:2-deoxystreptamine N-acetyl-D-glucosaminyltransferase/2-deoxystreptamine glucosyltransferase
VVHAARAHALPTALLLQNTVNLRTMELGSPQALARRLRQQYRAMSTVIAVARHLGDRARALGFPDVRVIENAADARDFVPQPPDLALLRALDIRQGEVVVAHVSNLKPWKRPLDVVESATLALRRDPRLVYLVVGDGPLRVAMEEACRSAGQMDRFRFAGWVDHARVPAYLCLADLVLMPSEHEARALVYLETQACGRVLLASDIPAAREVIRDGETGVLFGKGDVRDLAAKTLRLAGDPRLRARIGARAREAAEGRSVDALLDAYEAALWDLARRSGRGDDAFAPGRLGAERGTVTATDR